MPPKRRTERDEGSDTDTDVELNRTVISSPNVTMSEDMLNALVSNITRGQVEANRVLIESISAGNKNPLITSQPRAKVADAHTHAPRARNFAKCTARFNGSSKNADELEALIEAIEVYRNCTNVSNEHALRGLPMLLVGEAAVWWQGRSSVTSWTDALQRLRGMFGVPRPGYKILPRHFRYRTK
ncbi:uncharacterized protein LOC111360193 [Spodoptera litura]|uniref:Uncharacterized protein LOC111360193 n=1 Tax=Spodoptera litura TaxID=69820 RepID=A0A9J7END5_SPOLT|nr:uncharacterized protein LOC111360193 [Spodoptera litura]